jgi:hypothetical protein
LNRIRIHDMRRSVSFSAARRAADLSRGDRILDIDQA